MLEFGAWFAILASFVNLPVGQGELENTMATRLDQAFRGRGVIQIQDDKVEVSVSSRFAARLRLGPVRFVKPRRNKHPPPMGFGASTMSQPTTGAV